MANGTIHLHGPRKKPCTGSNQPPVGNSNSQPVRGGANVQQSTTDNPDHISSSAPPTIGASATPQQGPTHPSLSQGLVKHVPKAARPICCSLLAERLRKITADTDDTSCWADLLDFGQQILINPPRAGKR